MTKSKMKMQHESVLDRLAHLPDDHNCYVQNQFNFYLKLRPTLQPVSTEAIISSRGISSVGKEARLMLALNKIAPLNLA